MYLLQWLGILLTCGQRNMELLVLENIESAIQKGALITQVPEQNQNRTNGIKL